MQEANFHSLYVMLLDKLGDKELYRLMVKTTMYYVKVRYGRAALHTVCTQSAWWLVVDRARDAPWEASKSVSFSALCVLKPAPCTACLTRARARGLYIQVLLYSERILKESNDRALLKNLGVWLGKLTFARNKPVLSRDLEIKSAIVEAYQRGRLIAVLPFVQKLLECCNGSRVFTPANPMVSGILSLLAELHAMKVGS